MSAPGSDERSSAERDRDERDRDERPRLSIVITCYNYARYVGHAIDSALAQDCPGVEVIVVDDGSTDASPEVIARYGDRIRSIRQPNQGSIPAYNRGYAESRADLVLFLDADDVAAPQLARRVLDAWRPGCVKVQYDLSIIDAQGDDLGRRFCHFDAGYDAAAVRRSFERTGTYLWPVTAGNVLTAGGNDTGFDAAVANAAAIASAKDNGAPAAGPKPGNDAL